MRPIFQSIRSEIARGGARICVMVLSGFTRPRSAVLWFGTFQTSVQREADLFIHAYGSLAYRYVRDHVRFGQRRKRARDVELYLAVAEEIAKRNNSSLRAACAAGAVLLLDWLLTLNGTLALLV